MCLFVLLVLDGQMGSSSCLFVTMAALLCQVCKLFAHRLLRQEMLHKPFWLTFCSAVLFNAYDFCHSMLWSKNLTRSFLYNIKYLEIFNAARFQKLTFEMSLSTHNFYNI